MRLEDRVGGTTLEKVSDALTTCFEISERSNSVH